MLLNWTNVKAREISKRIPFYAGRIEINKSIDYASKSSIAFELFLRAYQSKVRINSLLSSHAQLTHMRHYRERTCAVIGLNFDSLHMDDRAQ